MDRSESIRRQFEAAAHHYANSSYHQSSPDLAAMRAAIALGGSERVLDVGTGAGHTAVAFAPAVREVVALDLTPAMLEEARLLARRAGAENVRFEVGDAMDLPYADAEFDVVTCRVCAHHFADVGAAAGEMARVLRSGGTLLLVDSVSPEDAAQDTFLNCIEVLRDPSHVRNYSVSQWHSLLEIAGFDAECLNVWSVPLDFDEWVERMNTPEPVRRQLRSLFEGATDPVRKAFHLRCGESRGFDMPIGFFRGRRRSG